MHDNLHLDWITAFSINSAAAFEYPARMMDRRWRRWDDAWAADACSVVIFPNSATLLQEPDDLHETIARISSFYAAGGGGPYLLWSAWPQLECSTLGLEHFFDTPIMGRQSPGFPPIVPPELRIVEVHDVQTLADYEAAIIDGFPFTGLQPVEPGRFLDTRVLGGPLHAYVGYVGERPVTGAMAFITNSAVGIYYVATLPDARGRGYGAAVTHAATQVAPHLPAVLTASRVGRSVYERIGFTVVATCRGWRGQRQPSTC
jgi:GNAT superfamily N-acetyltransferase